MVSPPLGRSCIVRLARLGPHEGLECFLVKMGRTGPLVEPRRGPQAGKSGDPRSQDADTWTFASVSCTASLLATSPLRVTAVAQGRPSVREDGSA